MASEISGLTITVIFLFCAVTLFRRYAKYKLNYWTRRGVESLPADDIVFGNFRRAILFQSAPGWHIGQIYKAAKPDAPYVGFYIFHKPCILLRDPKIIKQVLMKDFDNFSDRHFAGSEQKDSIGMINLFGLKNPTWKYLRNKITPTLTKSKIRQMLPLMLETGKPMMKYLNNRNTDKNGLKLFDAEQINYKFTTDLIASIALGTKSDSFYYPNEEFSKCFQEFFHGLKRKIALLALFFLPEIVEVFGSFILSNPKFIEKIFWEAMDSREKCGQKRSDFIDSLITLKNGEQNPHYKFEGENLLHQSGIFFSGFESSSTAAGFTLMELANHQECQERARQEIKIAIEKYGMIYEAFNNMKYLDRVIAESIRLHPPVSTIDRCCLKDYKIPGTDIIIEKGTAVFISLHGLQEDPRYFEDPEHFNPDRFEKGGSISGSYIPFGTGPRMCIGMKLGQLHVKVVTSLILLEYEVTQHEGMKSVLCPRSTFTTPVNGINLYFKKINNVENNGSIS